ncbi:MAG: substrate-binding domain-containing protein [Anaerolineaceae bacterium]|nr:substrate-binding domain-containing protein [Anaerolineaceae bacterium]
MKRFLSMLLVVTLAVGILAACASQPTPAVAPQPTAAPAAEPTKAPAGNTEAAPAGEKPFNERGYKIAYLLQGASTDIFKMAFDAAVAEGKKLGITVDIFTANGDDVKFQDLINQCINQKYDGLFISHGKNDYSYKLVKTAVDAGIKVVTFDTVVKDEAGNGIPGVTTMFQDDQGMARMTLEYITQVLFPDKKPVRLLKLWRGPGIPPFDRRQEVYKEFEDAGKIQTLELLGPSNPKDSEGSMNQVVASVLPKYPAGSVDAIWSAYDAYARGAYKALYEANRTDIPLVTIDISNQDINYMLEPTKVWKACVAVHFENVGIQGVRLLAMKLHGDTTPDTYNLKPSMVKAEDLKEGANVTNLTTIVPGYGIFDDHWETWMQDLQKK